MVEDEFIPEFRAFLHELYADTADLDRLGHVIHRMYRFFQDYDFDRAMRSYGRPGSVFFRKHRSSSRGLPRRTGIAGARFSLADVSTAMHWLYHWFFPLAQRLPRPDVVHAAMAGLCTLVATAVKLEYGAPYMLTEHGIYLRERYLAEAGSTQGRFSQVVQSALRAAHDRAELQHG